MVGLAGTLPSATKAYTCETYYWHWLNALERIVAANRITTSDTLQCYQAAWDRAAGRTPHGQPIELPAGDFG